MQYRINNPDMNVQANDEIGEIVALKLMLSAVIFTLPSSQRDAILKSISEINEPSVSRVYKQIMQLHPSNN